MNDRHLNIGASRWQDCLLLALLTSVTNPTHDFLSLAGENYAKLIAEIILKVNYTCVRIDMFRSLKHI